MQDWHSKFSSLYIDSFTERLPCLIVPNVVSILLQIVDIHQIDLQHEDGTVEVHFPTERVHLRCERLSASSLLQILEAESVAELRVPELTRK